MVKFDFTNRVALVTGAASGIGLATSKAFAVAGAKVALVDMNFEAVKSASQEFNAQGFKTIGIACDVANEEQVKNMVEQTIKEFGRLDYAYNNVGIHAPVAPIHEAVGGDFDRVIAVNLRGVWSCMKYELREILKHGKGGAIVNCSSQSGLVGTANIGAYTASKHGVVGLTKCAGLEYAEQGVRINCICPGTSDTPMVAQAAAIAPEHMKAIIELIPLKRMGRPEEIADTVLWLCSDNAGFIIGQAIAIDGGYTIK